MKKYLNPSQCRAVLFGLAAFSAWGAHAAEGLTKVEPDDAGWRVSASASLLFNVSTSFKGHPAGPLLTGANDHAGAANYDNGFVGRDVSNDPNLSTYWGYGSSSQQVVAGDNVTGLNFARTSAQASAGSPSKDADVGVGEEITLRRELMGNRHVRGGLELGFAIHKVEFRDTSSYRQSAVRTSYSYNMAGPIPSALFPPGGYQGPYAGAGPVINPTENEGGSSLIPNAVLVSGSREADAGIFGFRLGPYVELPLTKNLSASVSAGGLLVVVVDSVTWSENLSVDSASTPGYWTGSSRASDTSCGAVGGFYAGLDLNWEFTKDWSLVVGAHFQDAGTYAHHLGAGQMDWNLGQMVTANVGVAFSF
ncbi:MAG: hypothetical protein P4N60_08695 [Verrucomicrobiae bacterium]|nr:hypothetical protein [Verrucomicrobiae bacterium]